MHSTSKIVDARRNCIKRWNIATAAGVPQEQVIKTKTSQKNSFPVVGRWLNGAAKLSQQVAPVCRQRDVAAQMTSKATSRTSEQKRKQRYALTDDPSLPVVHLINSNGNRAIP